MDKKNSILVFGGGILQLSIIRNCKAMGLNTIVIDPNPNAGAKELADLFIEVGGQDFDKTCEIIEKHAVKGIVTAATDKPLSMMARIAAKYNFPFYSEKTAQLCTDKFLMQEQFKAHNLACAEGKKIYSISDVEEFPVIIKPVDNSGSRGVFYCADRDELESLFEDSFQHTKKDYLLLNTVLDGEEYSIESFHCNGKTHVLQVTHKITTDFPTNVELSHTAPAIVDTGLVSQIKSIVEEIAEAFDFDNCVSHTELKIKDGKITIIETSPRTGGDYITSHLVPLSTEINIENLLISCAMGEIPIVPEPESNPAGIFYFLLPKGTITKIDSLNDVLLMDGVKRLSFKLFVGDSIPVIKNSLDRYGFVILKEKSIDRLEDLKERIFQTIIDRIEIE